jgi:hypothetical protein
MVVILELTQLDDADKKYTFYLKLNDPLGVAVYQDAYLQPERVNSLGDMLALKHSAKTRKLWYFSGYTCPEWLVLPDTEGVELQPYEENFGVPLTWQELVSDDYIK